MKNAVVFRSAKWPWKTQTLPWRLSAGQVFDRAHAMNGDEPRVQTMQKVPAINRFLVSMASDGDGWRAIARRNLAIPAGLEPATRGVEIRYSIQLSYGTVSFVHDPERDHACAAPSYHRQDEKSFFCAGISEPIFMKGRQNKTGGLPLDPLVIRCCAVVHPPARRAMAKAMSHATFFHPQLAAISPSPFHICLASRGVPTPRTGVPS
jgi:hypothetical protein